MVEKWSKNGQNGPRMAKIGSKKICRKKTRKWTEKRAPSYSECIPRAISRGTFLVENDLKSLKMTKNCRKTAKIEDQKINLKKLQKSEISLKKFFLRENVA